MKKAPDILTTFFQKIRAYTVKNNRKMTGC